MTGNEIKQKQENDNAGHLTSFIVKKITELEMMNIKKETKINLFDAIIQVIKTIKQTMEE